MSTAGNANQEGYNMVGEVTEPDWVDAQRVSMLVNNVPDVVIKDNNNLFFPVVVEVSECKGRNVCICVWL